MSPEWILGRKIPRQGEVLEGAVNLPFLVAPAFSLRSDRVQRGTGTFTAKLAIIGRSPLHAVSQPSLAPDFFRVTICNMVFARATTDGSRLIYQHIIGII